MVARPPIATHSKRNEDVTMDKEKGNKQKNLKVLSLFSIMMAVCNGFMSKKIKLVLYTLCKKVSSF